MGLSDARRVFIYLDRFPAGDSGAGLRFRSNIQAYLDLGFQVEVIEFPFDSAGMPPGDLPGAKWSSVVVAQHHWTIKNKAAYRIGLRTRGVYQAAYSKTGSICRAVEERSKKYPGAIHQFEGDSIAHVIPFVHARSIYSCHEISRDTVGATMRISCELESRRPFPGELRHLRFVSITDRRIATNASLTLCISEADRDTVRTWGLTKAEHLPMSIPDENNVWAGQPIRGSTVRLLHIGALAHLPTYRSLEHLFGRVLPVVPGKIKSRIEVRVAGRFDPGNIRCQRILPMIRAFPAAALLGFVDDVREEFAAADIQVIVPTEATGLQTRIIESFARGLPVLASSAAARGVTGAKPGTNLLVADDPALIAAMLAKLVEEPECLTSVARAARETYDRLHSRAQVARRLEQYLARYFQL